MPEPVLYALQMIARWLEIIGAIALIAGFLYASYKCLRQWRLEGRKSAMRDYRKALGRTVLIGLEVLVAATIIKTITLPPTGEAIGFLAIMVAIRTTLGWTMVLEMYGHWPWQKAVLNRAKTEP
jgi:uncharacterized membrane protein